MDKLIAKRPELIYEIVDVFKEQPGTLNELKKLINKKSKADSDPDKCKGDLFEIVSGMFFNLYQNDPTIGLTNYDCIEPEDDYGVDAIGVNVNNNQVAIQVKYRNDPKHLITYSDIAKTYTYGSLHHHLDLNQPNSIYLFTTALGINIHCEKVFGNIIRVINYKIIERFIDGNYTFWRNLYKEVFEYLDS